MENKKTAHTPGPWTLGGFGEIYSPGVLPTNSGGKLPTAYLIAKVPRNPIDALGVQADESRANARLIAAAPDLLDAVRAVQRLIDSNSGQLSPMQAIRADEILRSAIAKAEGK